MQDYLVYGLIGLVVLVYLFRAFGPGRKASTKEVLARIEAGARIIDVRSPAEFKGGAYPGAINIPLDQIATRIDRLKPLDSPIIVYCASGMRSGQAAAMLRKAGFTQVSNGGGLSSMPR